MDIKILTSITTTPESERDCFVIGTHNGIFHSDDVVAVAIICMLHSNEEVWVVRSRNTEVLDKCDICVDIGGGLYDHHMPGFDLARADGVKYASAGLIWKEFGETVILNSLEECDLIDVLSDYCCKIASQVDANLIKYVDAEDNGIELGEHHLSFISSFLPMWYESKPDFDLQFSKVLSTTITVLEREIGQIIGEVYATKEILNRTESCMFFSDSILEIPSQTIPWLTTICSYNKADKSNNSVKFVIFPYPAGGWAAQSVPPSEKERFKQIVPFPKAWAGQTLELPQISGVEDATFCHSGCFFARAMSRSGIIKLCQIALELNQKK